MKICVISTGQELLREKSNLNLFYIAKRLHSLGLDICCSVTVPDKKDVIKQILKSQLDICDIIIITGGLGPTSDDVTVESVGEFLNKNLVVNKEVYQHIVRHFIDKGEDVPERSKRQAYVIDDAEIFINKVGLAPGQKITYHKKHIYLLPGPHREFQPMFDDYVFPELKKFQTGITKESVLHICGIPESKIEEIISPVIQTEKKYSSDIEFAILPHLNIVDIKITVSGKNELLVDEELRLVKKEIYDCFNNNPEYGKFTIYGEDKESLEYIVGVLLGKHKKTLAVAESCTGGLFGHRITQIPGSSLYFLGSVVTYSNFLKMKVLNVKKETLDTYGAVSEETVKEMCIGLKSITNADYCISISGIAGPGGGTPQKPVGTVWLCIYHDDKFFTCKFLLKGSRWEIKDQVVNLGLDFLRKIILKTLPEK